MNQKEISDSMLKDEAVKKKTESFNRKALEFLGSCGLERKDGEEYELLHFSTTSWIKHKEVFQVPLNAMLKLIHEVQKKLGAGALQSPELLMREYEDKKSLSCTKVFCVFLLFVNRLVSGQGFFEMFLYFCIYRTCLNQKGAVALSIHNEDRLDDLRNLEMLSNRNSDFEDDFEQPALQPRRSLTLSEKNGKRSPTRVSVASERSTVKEKPCEFADCNSPEIVSDLSNDFYSKSVPEALSDKGFIDRSFHGVLFGSGKAQQLNCIVFTKLFCGWLHMFGFSDAIVELNQVSSAVQPSL